MHLLFEKIRGLHNSWSLFQLFHKAEAREVGGRMEELLLEMVLVADMSN